MESKNYLEKIVFCKGIDVKIKLEEQTLHLIFFCVNNRIYINIKDGMRYKLNSSNYVRTSNSRFYKVYEISDYVNNYPIDENTWSKSLKKALIEGDIIPEDIFDYNCECDLKENLENYHNYNKCRVNESNERIQRIKELEREERKKELEFPYIRLREAIKEIEELGFNVTLTPNHKGWY